MPWSDWKKFGSISQATVVAESKVSGFTSATYTATENNECVVAIGGHAFSQESNGNQLFTTGEIYSGGAHKMGMCGYILNAGQYLKVSGWENVIIYKLS